MLTLKMGLHILGGTAREPTGDQLIDLQRDMGTGRLLATHRDVPRGVQVQGYGMSCSDLLEANGTEIVSDVIV